MKLKHTRDTLEVFLYVVKEGKVDADECATHFGRSRYWARGCLDLLSDSENALLDAKFDGQMCHTYSSRWTRENELEALRTYCASCE